MSRPGVPPPSAALTAPLAARLSALHGLGPEQLDRIRDLRAPVRTYPASELIRQDCGDATEVRPPCFVVSGWAAHLRRLPDQRRQLLSVLLPGDLLEGAQGRPFVHAPVVALTEVRLMDVSSLLEAAADAPSLAAAVASAGRAEELRLLDQLVRLGRLSARERVAHWLIELEDRLRTVGLATDGAFRLPISQPLIGDFLSLSVVHVNRTLRELRTLGLIAVGPGWIQIRDPPGLVMQSGARSAASPPVK